MLSRKHPPLFRHIETLHAEHPWGSVLDAGTGVQSIRWLSDLRTQRWTAVSASPAHAKMVGEAVREQQRADDKIIIGNWVDPALLKGQVFDTVIADYLLGAVEGFSPCFQPYLFRRLRPLTGQRLYVKGLEPYVPTPRPEDEAGQIVWELGRFRDACVLLGGDIPYREYPARWVCDHLQFAGFKVVSAEHFPIRYKAKFVNAQIDLCLPGLETVNDHKFVSALKARGEALRERALDYIQKEGALPFGRNYVIAAQAV